MSEEEKENLERYLRLREAELNDNMDEIIEEEYQKFVNGEDEDDSKRKNDNREETD